MNLYIKKYRERQTMIRWDTLGNFFHFSEPKLSYLQMATIMGTYWESSLRLTVKVLHEQQAGRIFIVGGKGHSGREQDKYSNVENRRYLSFSAEIK